MAGLDEKPVVIDNGTGLIKVGFAGDDAPVAVFHTVVGRPRRSPLHVDGIGRSKILTGGEALANRSTHSVTYPVDRGVVSNWDDMQRIWDHAFYDELHIKPKNHPVLLTEVPLNPRENREKMAEIMFEENAVPATYFAMPALLSFYSSGCTTGIALDCGHGVCSTVPVYDGNILYEGIIRSDIAGLDLNIALKNVLEEMGYTFTTSWEQEIITHMKENLCYVATEYEQELKIAKTTSTVEKIYELPDGQEITVGIERFVCPEALFRPSMIGENSQGIHQTLHDCLNQCNINIKRRLCSNILLSGGSMMLPGIADRLEKELSELAPQMKKINFVPCKDPYSVWVGGSILASLSSFQKDWISRVQYDEVGSSVVHSH